MSKILLAEDDRVLRDITVKYLKKNGYDVTMFNVNEDTSDVQKVYAGKEYINVISTLKTALSARIDTLVATMWTTLDFARSYKNCNDVRYLVQSRESGFYESML